MTFEKTPHYFFFSVTSLYMHDLFGSISPATSYRNASFWARSNQKFLLYASKTVCDWPKHHWDTEVPTLVHYRGSVLIVWKILNVSTFICRFLKMVILCIGVNPFPEFLRDGWRYSIEILHIDSLVWVLYCELRSCHKTDLILKYHWNNSCGKVKFSICFEIMCADLWKSHWEALS